LAKSLDQFKRVPVIKSVIVLQRVMKDEFVSVWSLEQYELELKQKAKHEEEERQNVRDWFKQHPHKKPQYLSPTRVKAAQESSKSPTDAILHSKIFSEWQQTDAVSSYGKLTNSVVRIAKDDTPHINVTKPVHTPGVTEEKLDSFYNSKNINSILKSRWRLEQPREKSPEEIIISPPAENEKRQKTSYMFKVVPREKVRMRNYMPNLKDDTPGVGRYNVDMVSIGNRSFNQRKRITDINKRKSESDLRTKQLSPTKPVEQQSLSPVSDITPDTISDTLSEYEPPRRSLFNVEEDDEDERKILAMRTSW
jgi:hypothetical protein